MLDPIRVATAKAVYLECYRRCKGYDPEAERADAIAADWAKDGAFSADLHKLQRAVTKAIENSKPGELVTPGHIREAMEGLESPSRAVVSPLGRMPDKNGLEVELGTSKAQKIANALRVAEKIRASPRRRACGLLDGSVWSAALMMKLKPKTWVFCNGRRHFSVKENTENWTRSRDEYLGECPKWANYK